MTAHHVQEAHSSRGRFALHPLFIDGSLRGVCRDQFLVGQGGRAGRGGSEETIAGKVGARVANAGTAGEDHQDGTGNPECAACCNGPGRPVRLPDPVEARFGCPAADGCRQQRLCQDPEHVDDPAYEAFDQGKFITALELALKAAQNGDPQAHTLVGRIYAEGNGAPQNLPLAAQWYARAAQLGDPEAMFAYGLMLAEGKGVAKNREAAAQMFEAAASHKHALANYNLGLLYLRGDGKPENPYRAFGHMLFAAEAGVPAAQYDVGNLYATGTGVDPNAFEAVKWIGKAAAAGYAEAQLDYAVILFRGHGVPPDPKRGAQLFQAAADKGMAVAQNRLARCYEYGAGVEANPIEAAKWHLIAKAGGVEDDNLDKIVAKLSKADRAKAQKAADAWRDRQQIGIE